LPIPDHPRIHRVRRNSESRRRPYGRIQVARTDVLYHSVAASSLLGRWYWRTHLRSLARRKWRTSETIVEAMTPCRVACPGASVLKDPSPNSTPLPALPQEAL